MVASSESSRQSRARDKLPWSHLPKNGHGTPNMVLPLSKSLVGGVRTRRSVEGPTRRWLIRLKLGQSQDTGSSIFVEAATMLLTRYFTASTY